MHSSLVRGVVILAAVVSSSVLAGCASEPPQRLGRVSANAEYDDCVAACTGPDIAMGVACARECRARFPDAVPEPDPMPRYCDCPPCRVVDGVVTSPGACADGGREGAVEGRGAGRVEGAGDRE